MGRNVVDIGNLVGQGEATVLTDITQFDPMFAYFNLNERDLLRLIFAYRKRVEELGIDPRVDPDRKAEIKVYLGLANEEGYPHEGIADYADSGVDAGTGTLQLRGVFDNPGPVVVLQPGFFARIRMPVAKRDGASLVAERAIGADQTGRFVLVVNSDNVVEKRNVVLGSLVDGLRVIEDGLMAEDRVVVNGIQRARPGGTVKPTSVDMASLKTSVMFPGADDVAPGAGTASDGASDNATDTASDNATGGAPAA